MSEQAAVEQWHDLVERRRLQMDAAYQALRRTSDDFWERRAGRFRRYAGLAGDDHPLVRRALALLPPAGSVLDVGAGTGRYALPIARHAGLVIAVEPSAEMVGMLREEAAPAGEGRSNLSVVSEGWLEAESRVPQADIVLCANVLYPHAEIEAWLRSLDAHARVAVLVEMMADWNEPPVLLDLWRRFHGDARVLQPSYFDAYRVLHEFGIPANVEVYPARGSFWRFDSLDEALESVREHLILPAADDVDDVLRSALMASMQREGDAWVLPSPRAAATIWWERDGPRLQHGRASGPKHRVD